MTHSDSNTSSNTATPTDDYIGLLDAAQKDRLFATQKSTAATFGDNGFAFGEQVAEVFDDMIPRSVPYYLDLQMLTASAAQKFYTANTAIYDLGCSTGTALTLIAKRLPNVSDIYGIDSSQPMIERAEQKLTSLGVRNQIVLTQEKIQDIELRQSSFIVANYTLQFIPLTDRQMILQRIYNSLVDGGAFLLTEKTAYEESSPQADLVRELHEDFKYQNGYSQIEIAQKREKLQGVMRPIREEDNLFHLREAGFTTVIEMMRGYSFITWLCVKSTVDNNS